MLLHPLVQGQILSGHGTAICGTSCPIGLKTHWFTHRVVSHSSTSRVLPLSLEHATSSGGPVLVHHHQVATTTMARAQPGATAWNDTRVPSCCAVVLSAQPAVLRFVVLRSSAAVPNDAPPDPSKIVFPRIPTPSEGPATL